MKRVDSININGIVFSIDDDAYSKLQSYLDTLSQYFKDEPGGNEIITDIEARIAELFNERLSGSNQVVVLDDVTQIIETLGTPEDIAGSDSDNDTDTFSTTVPKSSNTVSKRLYRDPDHNILGGVCAGIAVWLNVSPIIIRLVFLAITFFYGTSIPVYFLLWMIMPKAKTTTQKLEMRGQAATVSNIERNVRENQQPNPLLSESFRQFTNEAGEFLGKASGTLWRIFTIFLGIGLFFTGIGLCIGVGSLILMQDVVFHHQIEWDFLSFTELLQHIISGHSYMILFLCTLLFIILTISACLFWGIKLITGIRIKHKLAHIILLVIWILSIITGIIMVAYEARNFTWHNELTETVPIRTDNKTLYVSVSQSDLRISNNPLDNIYFDKENSCFYGKPSLSFRKSDDGQMKIELQKHSQGKSKISAYQFAENIEYEIIQNDSLITFPSYFTVVPQDKWKFQNLSVIIYVPAGTVIIPDKTFRSNRYFNRQVRNDSAFIMTDKNLKPLKSK